MIVGLSRVVVRQFFHSAAQRVLSECSSSSGGARQHATHSPRHRSNDSFYYTRNLEAMLKNRAAGIGSKALERKSTWEMRPTFTHAHMQTHIPIDSNPLLVFIPA